MANYTFLKMIGFNRFFVELLEKLKDGNPNDKIMASDKKISADQNILPKIPLHSHYIVHTM